GRNLVESNNGRSEQTTFFPMGNWHIVGRISSLGCYASQHDIGVPCIKNHQSWTRFAGPAARHGKVNQEQVTRLITGHRWHRRRNSLVQTPAPLVFPILLLPCSPPGGLKHGLSVLRELLVRRRWEPARTCRNLIGTGIQVLSCLNLRSHYTAAR